MTEFSRWHIPVSECKGSHGEPNNYTNVLGNNNVNVQEWPSLSPDLTQIENVWAELNMRVHARQPPLNKIQQLRHALIQEWNNIPQNHVANVIGPMRHRRAGCIQANGEYTQDIDDL